MKKKPAKAARKAASPAKPSRKAKAAPAKRASKTASSPSNKKAKPAAAKAGSGKAKKPAAPKATAAKTSTTKAGSAKSKAKPAAASKRKAPERKSGGKVPPDTASDIPALPDEALDPAFPDGMVLEPATREERAGLDKVMASLTQILGGRDFMSDAELDALLDDKMASGEIPPSAALDPLDEAQSLVYEAWNSEGSRRASLARRALELSDDCADAYLILAQEEPKSREAALELYLKAYEAGRRALDPALFAKEAGNFWSLMETRPYMRARLALAECQWDLGRKEDALAHLRELMRLNPSDNQGVRYILLQCLMESGADEELGDLLDRYGRDPSPAIAYTRALWQFRRAGRGKVADGALAEALKANPHVPAYLLKRKALPARAPAAASIGSPEEAEAYAAGALAVWHQTLGAVEWLASRS
jgi:tetratricopeptide (TPR) repeat protein